MGSDGKQTTNLVSQTLDPFMGQTPHERWKGKRTKPDTAQFGETVRYRVNLRGRYRDEKLEARWKGGSFLGKHWRVGEAVARGDDGMRRAATSRRLGSYRGRDAEGLARIRGRPWDCHPDEGIESGDLRASACWPRKRGALALPIHLDMEPRARCVRLISWTMDSWRIAPVASRSFMERRGKATHAGRG